MAYTGCFDWFSAPGASRLVSTTDLVNKPGRPVASSNLQSKSEVMSIDQQARVQNVDTKSVVNEYSIKNETTRQSFENDPSMDEQVQRGSQEKLSGRKKKSIKRNLIIGGIVIYATICIAVFVLVTVTIVLIWTRKMHYFVREPETVPISEVVNDASWYLSRFFFGSLGHIVLAVATTLILIKYKRTQEMTAQNQEKLVLLILVLASVLVLWMFSASISYIWSLPRVENGSGDQTVLPQFRRSGSKYRKCINASLYNFHKYRLFGSTDVHLEINQVRVNLKWMMKVSCSKASSDSKPIWKYALLQILADSKVLKDEDCVDFIEESMEAAKRDCETAELLDVLIYCWLILDALGVWFCMMLFYLYFKIIVHQRYGRFEFDKKQYEQDLIRLAKRIKMYADLEEKQSESPAQPRRESVPRTQPETKNV